MRAATGSIRNGVASEKFMMEAWQEFCVETELYLEPIDNLRDKSLHTVEWEDFYARIGDILRKDLELHIVEMHAKYIRKENLFELQRDGKKVTVFRTGFLFAGDAAPVGNESWTTLSYTLSGYVNPGAHVFNRLLATVPYGENHSCVEALMAYYSSAVEIISAKIGETPLSNGVIVEIQYTITLADWSAAAKFYRSYGAVATVNSLAYKNITRENQHLLKNVRGDDTNILEDLSFEDRAVFREAYLKHKVNFVNQAEALGWTADDIVKELDNEMREFAKINKNPQKGKPLPIMRNYVPENCHAGLRVTPNCIRRLNDTVQIAYKNGFSSTGTAVTDALR